MEISKEKIDKIIELYTNGETIKSIVSITGVSACVIHRKIKKSGISRRNDKSVILTEDIKDKILSMYNSHEQIKNIGKKLKISEYIIREFLIKIGISPPGSGRKRYFTDKEREDILSMFDSHKSILSISKKYNCNTKTITKIIDNNRTRVSSKSIGIKHGNWKGGRIVNNNGYIQIIIYQDDPYFSMSMVGGQILEHRYIMAKHLGRCLDKNESIHHIDGNRQNNKIENLQLRIGNHGKGHKCVCSDCGSTNITYMDI